MSKEVKEVKKVKVFFDEASHYHELHAAYEIANVFKAAKEELETILEKPIDNYTAFRKDILQYSIAAIKDKYPAAFNLNLGLEKTLQMLSIDLKKLERYDATLSTTPHNICVCPKKGTAEPSNETEPFTWYAETPEQHERLDFANELISNLEKCNEYAPYRGKHNLVMGLNQFVYLDPQIGLVANHNFVMNGIPQ